MFNFGLIKIAEDGKLVASINGIDGAAWYELPLHPHYSIRTENPLNVVFREPSQEGSFLT